MLQKMKCATLVFNPRNDSYFKLKEERVKKRILDGKDK